MSDYDDSFRSGRSSSDDGASTDDDSSEDHGSFGRRWLVDGLLALGLIVAAVGHRLVAVRTVDRWLSAYARLLAVRGDPLHVGERIGRIGGAMPFVACLEEAVVCRAFLEANGIESTVHLGVAKPTADGLEAHVWVTVGDRAIVGGSEDLSYYTPLPLEEWP